ncbi:hypothetical protein PSMEN_14490 [Ectopseudomonas mendocina]|nr:hypothetical protein PSMEN_14490 [Pseudomonas mendocina]
MSTVVISQPMYFPWVGMFEQWRLADDFVFFDDVQFARGFINRVQYKTPDGSAWLTVPLRQHGREARICDLQCADDSGWRDKHLRTLALALAGTPHMHDALGLAEAVLLRRDLGFCDLLIEGMQTVAQYFGLLEGKRLHRSSQLAVEGRKSALIQGLVAHLGGDRYVTGMGALNYLDHDAFECAGIEVCYMDYRKREYPQKFAPFTPYVTVLDLVANCGRDGRTFIESGVTHWRQALAARDQA